MSIIKDRSLDTLRYGKSVLSVLLLLQQIIKDIIQEYESRLIADHPESKDAKFLKKKIQQFQTLKANIGNVESNLPTPPIEENILPPVVGPSSFDNFAQLDQSTSNLPKNTSSDSENFAESFLCLLDDHFQNEINKKIMSKPLLSSHDVTKFIGLLHNRYYHNYYIHLLL
jgi:hypothetical protein